MPEEYKNDPISDKDGEPLFEMPVMKAMDGQAPSLDVIGKTADEAWPTEKPDVEATTPDWAISTTELIGKKPDLPEVSNELISSQPIAGHSLEVDETLPVAPNELIGDAKKPEDTIVQFSGQESVPPVSPSGENSMNTVEIPQIVLDKEPEELKDEAA